MKKILVFTLLLSIAGFSHAGFIASAECNSCSSQQAIAKAKQYKRNNDEGTVFIFDYGVNLLRKYKVKSFVNPRNGRQITTALTLNPKTSEIDLFADMTVLKNLIYSVTLVNGFGYDSAYDVIGCTGCQTGVGTWIINTDPYTSMAIITSNLATNIFKASPVHLNFQIAVTFSDGTKMVMSLKNGILALVPGTIVDANNNTIPDSVSDVSGRRFTFPPGTSVQSNIVQDLMNRIRDFGWDLGSGSGTCSFSCTAQSCTLSCTGY